MRLYSRPSLPSLPHVVDHTDTEGSGQINDNKENASKREENENSNECMMRNQFLPFLSTSSSSGFSSISGSPSVVLIDDHGIGGGNGNGKKNTSVDGGESSSCGHDYDQDKEEELKAYC